MIKLLVLMGIFNHHPTFKPQEIPVAYIEYAYIDDRADLKKLNVNCIVALTKQYAGIESFYYVKNTCEEVRSLLRPFYGTN